MLGLLNFDRLFPETARDETRFLTVTSHETVPVDTYALREFYCVEPGCDCRRLVFHVESIRTGQTVASISFGFDRGSEYAGPDLDPLNPQTRHSNAVLEILRDEVLVDESYVRRLERHYGMVKEVADDPSHPRYDRIPGVKPLVRQEKVGRNDRCPCGSGKKYKKCCLEKDEAAAAKEIEQEVESAWAPDEGDDEGEDLDELEDEDDTLDDGDELEDGSDLGPYAALKWAEDRDELGPERSAPSAMAELGLDEILDRLGTLGVVTSRDAFPALTEGRSSAWSIAEDWKLGQRRDLTQEELDFLGLAACELWKRLCPLRPSQEQLHDRIEEGYALLAGDKTHEAHGLWWDVWQTLRARLRPEMRTIDQARALFEVGSLGDWVVDFSDDLYEEALGAPAVAPRAVELAEQLLAAFPDEEEAFRFTLRCELGELLFLVGRGADGAALLLELIREHPERAAGYLHLSDAFERQGDLPSALEVLEQARKADVEDYTSDDGLDEEELEERIEELRERIDDLAGRVSSDRTS